MSKTNETTVDLSNRNRVGPEEESREDQFDGNELDAVREKPSGAATEETAATDRHEIDHSNDLTTP